MINRLPRWYGGKKERREKAKEIHECVELLIGSGKLTDREIKTAKEIDSNFKMDILGDLYSMNYEIDMLNKLQKYVECR